MLRISLVAFDAEECFFFDCDPCDYRRDEQQQEYTESIIIEVEYRYADVRGYHACVSGVAYIFIRTCINYFMTVNFPYDVRIIFPKSLYRPYSENTSGNEYYKASDMVKIKAMPF